MAGLQIPMDIAMLMQRGQRNGQLSGDLQGSLQRRGTGLEQAIQRLAAGVLVHKREMAVVFDQIYHPDQPFNLELAMDLELVLQARLCSFRSPVAWHGF